RVLDVNGIAFISDLKRDAPKELVEEIIEFLSPLQRRAFLNSINESYTIEELKTMLRELNIQNFEVKPQRFSRQAILKNIEEIKNATWRSEKYNQLNLNIVIRK
ncbi:MAG: hypothetical protein N2Z79_00790, partial [Candidatus Omnitrophica bacterium]|nr:hypothetical protein [Candidatus Omnitrophota bacterium]